MIRVLFLAQLREQLAIAELDVVELEGVSIAGLKQYLVAHHPTWEPFLLNSKILTAVNHQYVKDDALIKAGDEVAFFPPVTGG